MSAQTRAAALISDLEFIVRHESIAFECELIPIKAMTAVIQRFGSVFDSHLEL